MPSRSILLLLSLLATLTATAQQAPYGTHLNGQPITTLADPGTKAVVLFFVASDCPISNKTFPAMKRLREDFTSRHIRFWFVYPNPTEQPTQILQHQSAYDPGGDPILDPTSALVHLVHARVTPEVAILLPAGRAGWHAAYIGRIDNRYLSIGQERPHPTVNFAAQALTALLAGAPIQPPTGTPVGCAIIGNLHP